MLRFVLPVLAALLLGVFASGALAETLKIPNTKPEEVRSKTALKPAHAYKITASGRVSDWPDDWVAAVAGPEAASWDGFGVDAIWCYAQWRCGDGLLWRQLRVKRAAEAWGDGYGQGLDQFAGLQEPPDYTPGVDRYRFVVRGIKGRLDFATWDAFALKSHAGNKGAFKVTITDLGTPLPTFTGGESFWGFLEEARRVDQRIRRAISKEIKLVRKAKTKARRTAALRRLQRRIKALDGFRVQMIALIVDAKDLQQPPFESPLHEELARCIDHAWDYSYEWKGRELNRLEKLTRALRSRNERAIRARQEALDDAFSEGNDTYWLAARCVNRGGVRST